MTYQLPNPLRAVLRYMRGDDIKEANNRAIALSLAARASGASPTAATAAPPVVAATAATAPAAPVDRRRM